jgi:hypothetical protein
VDEKPKRHKERFLVPVLLFFPSAGKNILNQIAGFFSTKYKVSSDIIPLAPSENTQPTQIYDQRKGAAHPHRQGSGLSRQAGPGGPGPDTLRA